MENEISETAPNVWAEITVPNHLSSQSPQRDSAPQIRKHTKKGQTLRSDLEEAATYSPTGKPQYHRRK